jgi:hypothetical protein
MQTNSTFINSIRALIASDAIAPALEKMRVWLADSPHIEEILLQSGRFSIIRKEIRKGLLSQQEAQLTKEQFRFGLLDLLSEIEQGGAKPLPSELAQNLFAHRPDADEEHIWVQSLYEDLKELGISVTRRPKDIFKHYGWLIEANLLKMLTKPNGADAHPPLRQLSYMTEAFQCSLRYLCFIQAAQWLTAKLDEAAGEAAAMTDFLHLRDQEYQSFDYLNLLFSSTERLQTTSRQFVPEINGLVADLLDRNGLLCETALFLDDQRSRLLRGEIAENDPNMDALLDQYLTGLVYWLRRLAFLAHYRMVSIKDINLSYRLGSTTTKFMHLYGELHGMYTPTDGLSEDWSTKTIEGLFTYNQSVLLFRGKNVDDCLERIGDSGSYISLSPLVIDQSVYANKATQTPEVFCYAGHDPTARQYDFAEFKNELALDGRGAVASNKYMKVRAQNNQQPKLNELYKHIEQVFKPFKSNSV